VLLAAATLVALAAMIGLIRAQEACIFQTTPCPQAGDPLLVLLDFGFFWIPLIWLAGVVLGIAAKALGVRRRSRRR